MTHNTPAPVADKALAERLSRLLGGEHEAEADGDYDTADLDQACGNAFRARQLITLAEAQEMVAAERERCAALIDEWWRGGVDTGVPADMIRALTPPADLLGVVLAMPEVRAMHTVAEYFAKKRKSILADIGSAHSGRGAGASSWMREDDSDFYRDLDKAFDTLDAALAALVQP